MTIPTLSTLPVAPARTDPPATFVTLADAFLAAIVTFQGEMNTSIGAMNTDIAQVNADAAAAAASETAAAASAAAAANTAGAALWVSGQAYAEGDAAISGVNYQTYRAETATSGTTDPSLDANWTAISGTFPVQTGNSGKYLTTDGTDTSWGVVEALPEQSGNAGSYLTTDGTDASWAEVSASPTLEATASGALANGDMVIVNADGTVSTVSGITQSLGSSSVFESANTNWISSTFDSNLNKIIVTYRDNGNSGYGTAVVGTVSGTSISFGTPSVFDSGSTTYTACAFDSSTNKVVIAYRDQGNSQGKGLVGTISGTSISFGGPESFATQADYISCAFDSNANKTLIAFRDSGAFEYGQAVVATVSGTTISFSAKYNFSTNTEYTSCAFDSSANKVVIAYRHVAGSSYGKAVVATISGTTISYGSPTTFNSSNTTYTASTFDSNENKIVIVSKDDGNSGVGTAVVGTVSGTSISFGSKVAFTSGSIQFTGCIFDSNANKIVATYRDSSTGDGLFNAGTVSGTTISFEDSSTFNSAGTEYTFCAFDSNSNNVVISYTNSGNSSYGTSIVLRNSSSNLNGQNYIGISDAAYADGVTAKIQIIGSVDDAQTGLTAGNYYYVTGTGSLSLVADEFNTFAGTAVSATKLIVKG
jgi:hypothetical protein